MGLGKNQSRNKSRLTAMLAGPLGCKSPMEFESVYIRGTITDYQLGGRTRPPRSTNSTWAKVKFDRQIVAIALVEGASAIYSDDRGVKVFGEIAGLRVVRIPDLPLRIRIPKAICFRIQLSVPRMRRNSPRTTLGDNS